MMRIPPSEPSLGSQPNEKLALANLYTADKLHLEMTNEVVI